MIGQGNIATEFFKQADATQVVKWAQSHAWVELVSYVSANRDTATGSGITQATNDFAKIFVQYEN